MSIRYVWLFLDTGEFSNSWTEREHEFLEKLLEDNENYKIGLNDDHRPVKLIKYECLNDENFEFYHQMRLR